MRKSFVLILSLIFLGCSKNTNSQYSNPYLPYARVSSSKSLNLLPNLAHPLGHEILDYNQGVAGIFVFNTGQRNNNGTYFYVAYDLACPNHSLQNCSTMEVTGIFAQCQCPEDESKFNLLSGTSETAQFPLVSYKVEVIGNTILVSNF